MTQFVHRLAILVLTAPVISCNIFETRTPEPPSQTSSNFNPAYNSSDVFDNMANAFRDLNTLNYLRSFVDSSTSGRQYQFDPTPQARSQYIGVFLNWSKQSEQQYFDNMRSKIQANSTATLDFTPPPNPISVQSDSAQYEAVYQLTIPHTQSNIPKFFQGRAQLFLLKDRVTSTWAISHWVDLRDAQGDVSWSDLKGEFAQ